MSWSRMLGILLQAMILGVLLLLAIGKLIALESGARIFQYQAF